MVRRVAGQHRMTVATQLDAMQRPPLDTTLALLASLDAWRKREALAVDARRNRSEAPRDPPPTRRWKAPWRPA